MQWPWVSRERLLEAIAVRDSRISTLEKQVDELNRERKRLTDFIAVRSNNLSIYGEINPQREEDPEPENPESQKDIEEQLKALPPSRARAFAKKREEHNLGQFEKEQQEAERLIAEMQEAGRRAAEEKAK